MAVNPQFAAAQSQGTQLLALALQLANQRRAEAGADERLELQRRQLDLQAQQMKFQNDIALRTLDLQQQRFEAQQDLALDAKRREARAASAGATGAEVPAPTERGKEKPPDETDIKRAISSKKDLGEKLKDLDEITDKLRQARVFFEGPQFRRGLRSIHPNFTEDQLDIAVQESIQDISNRQDSLNFQREQVVIPEIARRQQLRQMLAPGEEQAASVFGIVPEQPGSFGFRGFSGDTVPIDLPFGGQSE